MKIFAHDPGTANYGYAIVEGKRRGTDTIRFRVIENGLVPFTIKNLKDHKERREQKNKYREWCASKIEEHEPDALFGERFMTRGINGPTVESVNMMLGVLQCFDLPDVYIPAATWKNGVTRSGIELKEEYKIARVTPHQLDATLIGIYGLHKAFGIKDFGNMSQKLFDKLIDAVESTSAVDLINRKRKK